MIVIITFVMIGLFYDHCAYGNVKMGDRHEKSQFTEQILNEHYVFVLLKKGIYFHDLQICTSDNKHEIKRKESR